jgi:hypothetical protein
MLNLAWLEWSNPVSFWWVFLVSVSLLNVSFWIFTFKFLLSKNKIFENSEVRSLTKILVTLSFFYVFVCAFRSILPRADVQRICLFDTWLSSVFVGRSLATIAELAFVAQWALVIFQVSKIIQNKITLNISKTIVPLIIIAECFSWYAVTRTHYIGNTIEESIWGVTYFLISICLILFYPRFKGVFKYILGFSIVSSLLYVVFMANVDVPMYFNRWQNDIASAKQLLNFSEGIHDLQTRWIVTHDIKLWKEEIPWMSLYFSVAVWTSLALCYVPLSKQRLSPYLKNK